MRIFHSLMLSLCITLLIGCQWGPKEREFSMPAIHGQEADTNSGLYFDLHRVKVLKKLPTENYVYLEVVEGDRTFWIAARQGEIHLDSIYYYREALLKTEFESKQLSREFDSLYMVTKLIPEQHFKVPGHK